MFGFGKKKKETEQPFDPLAEPSEKKEWLKFWDSTSGYIPVNILRQRGKAVSILKTRGRLEKADKQAEVYRLKLANKKILDAVDYTRMDKDGSLTLIEKPDGELSYADVSKDVLTSTGDGLLRDAYIQGDNWINQNFKKKEDLWSKLAPVMVLGLVLACIAVSFYLTYQYLGGVTAQLEKLSNDAAKNSQATLALQEGIARDFSISLERLAQISADLHGSGSGGGQVVTVSTAPTTTTILVNSTVN